MSAVRSALEEIANTSDSLLSLEELAADVSELAHVAQQVDVLIARKVEGIASRHGFSDLGYSSATAFLSDVARMTPGSAKRVVSRSRMREKAPLAHAAWVDGRISTDQARYLFRAADAIPDSYPDAEEALIQIVEGLDASDTRRAVEYWRQAIDGPGDIDVETQQARRGVSASWVGGMLRVDGWLTTTAGQVFVAGLEANTPPRRDDDIRTPLQRRHDALENLARDWLDNGTTPSVGGEKPHINLHADIPALQGLAGGLHETEVGTIVDVDMLRMVACDCSVTRIVFGPDSEVIDVGRKTRVWNPAQRRAIVARDRHCQGPGCRAKPQYCDIHHTDHWADGGTTTVDVGRLLCQPCHTREHTKDGHRRRRLRKT